MTLHDITPSHSTRLGAGGGGGGMFRRICLQGKKGDDNKTSPRGHSFLYPLVEQILILGHTKTGISGKRRSVAPSSRGVV